MVSQVNFGIIYTIYLAHYRGQDSGFYSLDHLPFPCVGVRAGIQSLTLIGIQINIKVYYCTCIIVVTNMGLGNNQYVYVCMSSKISRTLQQD